MNSVTTKSHSSKSDFFLHFELWRNTWSFIRPHIFDVCAITASLILATTSSVMGAEVDLAELFAKTSPSVVTLKTYSASGQKLGEGSGFIVDKSGVIVTCVHVIAGADIVEIQSADESTHVASAIIRSDKDWDVALLKIDPLPQQPLKLAPPEAVRVGTSVIAIGSPLGFGNTLSQGIISGLRPHEGKGEMIQITAPISSGSSGGPILSASTGEILGLTVSSYSTGQNINFAAPASVIADQLKSIGKEPERILHDFTPAVKSALADAKKTRTALDLECTEADASTINRTIEQAIASGVGNYNAGNYLACFRIYEGAAYKMLYKLSSRSTTAEMVLMTALKKADLIDSKPGGTEGKGAVSEKAPTPSAAKAWIMRDAFDSIVGIKGLHK